MRGQEEFCPHSSFEGRFFRIHGRTRGFKFIAICNVKMPCSTPTQSTFLVSPRRLAPWPGNTLTGKLAAILAADVVGYSRLMGSDEEGTLSALKQHRQTIFDPAVAAHNGRIVKLIGDGTIVEFGSVVDAVSCALSIQRADGAFRTRRCVSRKLSCGSASISAMSSLRATTFMVMASTLPRGWSRWPNLAASVFPRSSMKASAIALTSALQDGGEIRVKNIDRPIRIWKWHPGATPDSQGQLRQAAAQCGDGIYRRFAIHQHVGRP